MAELYNDIPEAIENTQAIAEMCNLEMEFGRLHYRKSVSRKVRPPDGYLRGNFAKATLEKILPQYHAGN